MGTNTSNKQGEGGNSPKLTLTEIYHSIKLLLEHPKEEALIRLSRLDPPLRAVRADLVLVSEERQVLLEKHSAAKAGESQYWTCRHGVIHEFIVTLEALEPL